MTVNWISLIISVVALAFISLIMLLRGNDFRRRSVQAGRHVVFIRMIGFILAGFAPWGIVGWWFILGLFPSPFMTAFLVGVGCVFATTPNLPPLARFIYKGSDGT